MMHAQIGSGDRALPVFTAAALQADPPVSIRTSRTTSAVEARKLRLTCWSQSGQSRMIFRVSVLPPRMW